MALTVSVVVPSYRRPDQLADCLAGLDRLERPADEVVVVRREDDRATADAIASAPLRVVEVVVDRPGVLAALRAGALRSSGDVVAFTDDDAVPRPDWLAALLRHYDDPCVGGVGGRDQSQPATTETQVPASAVGAFNAWGRHTGNHHVGTGPAAPVDVLKGVNMSFRREALAVPLGLRGSGAEVHNEIAISLWARSHGWRLVYDPAAVVDHYHGPRFDSDQRSRPAKDAVTNEAYNLVFVLLSLRPELTLRRAAFGLLVGDRATPGVVRGLAAVARREAGVLPRVGPAVSGQVAALRDLARGRRLEMVRISGGEEGPGRSPAA